MDKINTVWAFGCSFTADYHPLDNDPPNNYDKYRDWKGGVLPDTYPKVLADMMGYAVKNLGVGASSNYHIFRNFCNSVSEIKENDVVIIGWTSLLRFVLVNEGCETIQDILPSQDYPEFNRDLLDYIVVNRANPIWNEEILSFMNIINEICKVKKINVFYWTSDDQMLQYWKDVDLYQDKKFIKTINDNTLLQIDEYGSEKNLTIQQETNGVVMDCHMGEFGHKKQAKIMYDYIKPFLL